MKTYIRNHEIEIKLFLCLSTSSDTDGCAANTSAHIYECRGSFSELSINDNLGWGTIGKIFFLFFVRKNKNGNLGRGTFGNALSALNFCKDTFWPSGSSCLSVAEQRMRPSHIRTRSRTTRMTQICIFLQFGKKTLDQSEKKKTIVKRMAVCVNSQPCSCLVSRRRCRCGCRPSWSWSWRRSPADTPAPAAAPKQNTPGVENGKESLMGQI